MRRAITSIAALAVATGALAACGDDADNTPGETQTVTVGIIPIVDVAPLYLGVEQGFFEEEGIELELQFADGGAAIVPGVASGEFDFGFSNVTSLLLAQSNGLPIEIVANGVASTGEAGNDFGAVMVLGDSDIQGAADLEGKTVAVNTLNNIGDTTIRESVRNAGGDATDIEFVPFGFPEMPAQLEEGNIDAAWVVEPFKSQIEAAGGRPVAWNYVDAAAGLTVATYFTTVDKVTNDSDLVERFTNAVNKSLAYADANPDDIRRIVGEYTEIPEAVRAEMVLPAWPVEINRGSIVTLAELGMNDGIFEAAPDVDALLP
jgi:NitT/TauT family transport system substrate-binding protein